jgi:SAM-dependent methyltransferase
VVNCRVPTHAGSGCPAIVRNTCPEDSAVTDQQADLEASSIPDEIYRRRFLEGDHREKLALWRVLAPYLDRLFPPGPVLDIACDRGYFIANIARSERWATDLRDTARELPADVRFVQADGLSLADVLPAGYFAGVFMSNYLEHLATSGEVVRQLEVAHALLRPNGRAIVLQPNIRLVGGAYWDFIDHHVALTERSLVEAAEAVGLRTIEVRTRFLPYSTKSRLPKHPALVRAYLAFPPVWRLLGKQTLYIGERPG